MGGACQPARDRRRILAAAEPPAEAVVPAQPTRWRTRSGAVTGRRSTGVLVLMAAWTLTPSARNRSGSLRALVCAVALGTLAVRPASPISARGTVAAEGSSGGVIRGHVDVRRPV